MMQSPVSYLARIALTLLATTAGLVAADSYILPAAAGSGDGSSWENARAGTSEAFQVAWDTLTPGDTLHVGSGTYAGGHITNSKSGEEGKPLRLVGKDTGSGLPLFTSTFDKNKADKSGATFFEGKFGTTHFEIDGFRLKGYKIGVQLRGRNANLKFSNLDIQEMREGIRSDGGGTPENPDAGTHNVTVTDCRFVNYTKRGVRMEAGNYNWKLERCFADAGGKEWATEPFHMGFQVANKSLKGSASFEHHIEYIDCVALNSYSESTGGKNKGKDPGTLYWNGDGFCAESGAHHLRYVRCVSMHHTDGGWDDKSESPEFIDCVGIDNKDNYRIWSKTGAATMTNCISAFANKRGGSGAAIGLWTMGSVNGQFCTFIDNPSGHISMDDSKGDPNAKLIFKDSIFVITPGSKGALGGGKHLELVDSILWDKGDPETDPQIPAKKGIVWTNGMKDFDSVKYGPAKGFSITRWGK